MRPRSTLILGALLAFFLAGGGASAASATDPLQLDPGYITDRAGALSSGERADLESHLDELFDDTGVNLFVVYVDHFTNPSDYQAWSQQVYNTNNLGPHQYLLSVAIEGRAYYLDAHIDSPLTDPQLDAIERTAQSPLGNDDWAGGAEAVADGLRNAFADDAGSSGETPPAGSGGGTGVLVLLLFLAAVAVVIWLIVRARRKKQGARTLASAAADQPYAGVSDKELERMAGSALVTTDDAITSSREELGFAIAQFGDASTETFTAVLEQAAGQLSEAFSLKQKLDDEIPDTDEQRRAWHIQILDLCEAAQDLLDDNLDSFDELRKLEQNAPAALESVRAQQQKLEARLAAAPQTLATLSSTFSPDALSTVSDNPQQARDRLQLAVNQMTLADAKLAEGVTGEAAFAIRTAEEAVLQAEQLLGALETIGGELQAIEQQAQALIADLESDLAAAASLPDASGQLASIAAQTRSSVDQARAQLASAPRSPQLVLDTLDVTNTRIDQSIAQVRDAIEQERRKQRAVEQKLLQAQSQIRAATDYISTRRGGISAAPRTRLAEAEASLGQAMSLQQTSPDQALQYATRAYDLATQGIHAAQNEINRFHSDSGYGGSGLGSDIVGGILGGIISSALTGGGSSGRRSSSRSVGWGGGSSRSSWGGGGGSRGRSGGSGFRSSGGGSRGRSGGGRF